MLQVNSQTAKTFSDHAYLAIAKHTVKFSKHESEVLRDQDSEELHQMRVALRKLRSAVVGFRLGLNLPSSAQDKNIGKIAQTLGKLRDLDVLGEIMTNKYLPDLPNNEQKQLNKIFKKLHKQRQKTFKLVKKTLKSKSYQQLKHSLEQWLNNPQYSHLGGVNIYLILPDLLLPEISKFLLHSGWFIGANLQQSEDREDQVLDNLSLEIVENILQNHGETLHDLRKEAKRCRYQMELFTDFYGDEYQNYLTDIKNVQTVLGDLQDNAILTELLNQNLNYQLAETMPVLDKLMQGDRYCQWQTWQKLQAKFLKNSVRQNCHQMILKSEQNQDSLIANTSDLAPSLKTPEK